MSQTAHELQYGQGLHTPSIPKNVLLYVNIPPVSDEERLIRYMQGKGVNEHYSTVIRTIMMLVNHSPETVLNTQVLGYSDFFRNCPKVIKHTSPEKIEQLDNLAIQATNALDGRVDKENLARVYEKMQRIIYNPEKHNYSIN